VEIAVVLTEIHSIVVYVNVWRMLPQLAAQISPHPIVQ
jgi:hypothetical protein